MLGKLPYINKLSQANKSEVETGLIRKRKTRRGGARGRGDGSGGGARKDALLL